MGMFDSIMMKVKCPYCGGEGERELQTKDLDCLLRVFRKGDFIDPNSMWYDRNYLNTISECISKGCLDQKSNGGYGRGKFFYAKVFLDDKNIITGEYEMMDEKNYDE